MAAVWRNLRTGNFRAASGDESFAQWWLAASMIYQQRILAQKY